MEYIKNFEDFVNESIINESAETKEEKISKLKGKINDLKGDILNVPRGGGGAIAKKRMNAELSKAQAELTLLTLKENEVNEGGVNESSIDLHKYVENAANRTNNKGGNGVNITDYGTMDLASQLEAYYVSGRGDENIYTDKTIKLFKQLIDSMSDDEINNNQWTNEGLNESKLTGKETNYNSKQLLMYFKDKYGYIEPSISSRDLEKWLKQDYIKKVNLEKAADYFQDYLLANGLADVQESKEVNESLFKIDVKLASKIYSALKAKYPEIGKDFTQSAFLYFLNDNIKESLNEAKETGA